VPELLPEDEPPIPVEPEPRPEPELLPVLGLLGLVVLPELEPPMLPELEPVLPVEPVLPEPEVLPYCFTQSSRCVPVRPTHWLGVAEPLLVEEPLPIAPDELDPVPLVELPELPDPLEPVPLVVLSELLEPEPTLGLVVELEPEPELGLVVELLPLPVALGLLDEPPILPELPEDCAHEAPATPTRAAATAAVRVFTITMYAPLVEIKRLQPSACKSDAAIK